MTLVEMIFFTYYIGLQLIIFIFETGQNTKDNQIIFTFENMKPENFWHLCLKSYLKYWLIIKNSHELFLF